MEQSDTERPHENDDAPLEDVRRDRDPQSGAGHRRVASCTKRDAEREMARVRKARTRA